MTLILHETDFKLFDGDGPDIIDLKATRTIIGRGSLTMPVDAVVFAKKAGLDIISRNHAVITRLPNGEYQVQDLKALNGTYVNSKKILTHTLCHGDVVQLGGVSSAPNGQNLFCVRYIFQADYQDQNRNNKKILTFSKNTYDEYEKKKGAKRGVKAIITDKDVDEDNLTFDYTNKITEKQKKKKLSGSHDAQRNETETLDDTEHNKINDAHSKFQRTIIPTSHIADDRYKTHNDNSASKIEMRVVKNNELKNGNKSEYDKNDFMKRENETDHQDEDYSNKRFTDVNKKNNNNENSNNNNNNNNNDDNNNNNDNYGDDFDTDHNNNNNNNNNDNSNNNNNDNDNDNNYENDDYDNDNDHNDD